MTESPSSPASPQCSWFAILAIVRVLFPCSGCFPLLTNRIATFVTLLRRVLPSPDDPLNGILCALDKLVVEFPKDSVKPVVKGSLFVSDISKVLQIKDPMGKGGQATVFSAVLRSTGMRVAVKVESKQMDSKAKLYFEVRLTQCGET